MDLPRLSGSLVSVQATRTPKLLCEMILVRPITPYLLLRERRLIFYTAVQEVAELNLDFRDIPAKKVWRRGVELYVVKFDVEMTVDSAGLVFCAVFGSGTKNAKRFEPKHVQLRSMG